MGFMSEKETVRFMAKAYRIAPETLWGVYGTETSFGKNIAVSSAGAKGPFQFIDGTAKQYKVDVTNFSSSARGAAHYLHDLGANSDPESAATAAALNSYSGGGGSAYTNKVIENGKTFKNDNPITDAIGGAVDSITAPIEAADNLGEAVGSGIKWLTDPSSWLRVGKGALGFTFIVVGTGAIVLVIAKPIAKSVIGVTGTGKAVKRAVKTVAQ